MRAELRVERASESILRRYPVTSYFLLTFAISWTGALTVAAPSLTHHTPMPRLSGILIFPAMLLGPLAGGLLMTRIVDGRAGIRELAKKMVRYRVSPGWYAVLLLPPLMILAVLSVLARTSSPAFAANHFWLGVAFGVPAGICEEIGWMGFAFPKMRAQRNALSAALVLGLLWSVWHLPAINFLGASAPHGRLWFEYFLAFAFVMTAMRALIAWIYTNTGSVLLTQLMHISSTGALVVFSPPVTSRQEVFWYAIYGAILWCLVTLVTVAQGRNLRTK